MVGPGTNGGRTQHRPRRNRRDSSFVNLGMSRGEPHSGNLVPVSCSDSSHGAAAVVARLAVQLRHVGWLRPYRPKRGPTKVLPGSSCDTAYNVGRAPKSASADLVADHIVALMDLPAQAGTIFNITADDYYNLMDITRILPKRYGYRFDYHDIPAFAEQLDRRCGPRDPVPAARASDRRGD